MSGSAAEDRGAARGAPPALMYHSISPATEADPYQLRVHPDRLSRQLRHLRRRGMRGVPFSEWLAADARGEAARLVALTFDDGYADFTEYAMPVLAAHGMSATVYVVSDRLSATNDWDADAPQVPLMSADDVRAAAAAGHEIGSHTLTHARLTAVSADQQHAEVTASRRDLESLIEAPVTSFCYPYGAFDAGLAQLVEEAGYDNACVTDDHSHPGRFTLARFYVGQRDTSLRLEAKLVRHRLRARTTPTTR